MKKLFVLALIAFAVWYGYHHYPELLNRGPSNEVVLKNESGHPLERRVGYVRIWQRTFLRNPPFHALVGSGLPQRRREEFTRSCISFATDHGEVERWPDLLPIGQQNSADQKAATRRYARGRQIAHGVLRLLTIRRLASVVKQQIR